MPLSFSCDCGKQLRVKDALAGKKIACPQCRGVLRVPASAGDSDSDDSSELRPVPRAAVRRPAPKPEPTASYGLSDDEEKRPLRRVLRRHDDDQDDTPEPRQPRRLRRRTTKTASSIPWKWIAGGAGLVVAFILLALFLNEMRTSEITLTPRGVIAVLVLFVSGVLAVIRFLNGEEVD